MSARQGIGVAVAVVAMAGAMSSVGADVVVFQDGVDGYAGTSDTSIMQESGALSAGGDDKVFVGRTQGMLGTSVRRGLLRFDVQEIPAGSTVTRVTFSVRLLASGTGGTTDTMRLHRLTKPWGEGTVIGPGAGAQGGPAQTGDATWTDNFRNISMWGTPGGDFAILPSAMATVTTVREIKTFSSTAALVADVQGWVDDPEANFGWILTGNEVTGGSIKLFGSSEHLVSGSRPRLEVEFEPPLVAGDCDGDGDVDLGDFLVLLACFGGPGVDAGEACDCADLDGDLDVDLSDVLAFQARFTDSR